MVHEPGPEPEELIPSNSSPEATLALARTISSAVLPSISNSLSISIAVLSSARKYT